MKKRKKIIQFLDDGIVEFNAYSEKLDEVVKKDNGLYRIPILDRKVKMTSIRVKFEIDGQLYEKDSVLGEYEIGYKEKKGAVKKGYHRFFNKYADKHIRILYSYKYDEVMILKDKQ
ncbi:MAG: hypothetical protein LBU60_03465 [Clostridiales bacterium]|jgi:hypothetical protein|nr:hypothetical protein [Clostridiales bacterium]